MELKIIAKKNERVFKEGQVIDIPIFEHGVSYIVGPNGSGKSTLLMAIRAHKDTIYENRPRHEREEIARPFELDYYKQAFDIEGLDEFKHVFALDAVVDNPISFQNASSATALIHSGGLTYGHQSRGEGTKFMVSMFIDKMQKITGGGFDKETRKMKDPPKEKSLILIDEMDEGLDLKAQSTYYQMLNNICKVFNASILCICHNPLCIAMQWGHMVSPVFDVSDFQMKPIGQYMKEQTGHEIQVDPVKNEE